MVMVALLFVFLHVACSTRRSSKSASASEAVGHTFVRCEAKGHYCDIMRNLRSVIYYESLFAYEHLSSVDSKSMFKFFDIFVRLHKHISSNSNCANLVMPEEYLNSIVTQGSVNVFDFGRMLANYVNAPEARFKKANDAIVDATAGPNSCAWNPNEDGLGTKLEALKARIRRHEGFMWGMKKGRGSNKDKVVMLTNVPSAMVTQNMVLYFAEMTRRDGDDADVSNNDGYDHLSSNDQQRLRPLLRWKLSFKNSYFGLFQYGDGAKHHIEYFYKPIIHGGGIHGRNTAEGNPAARMLDFGMPWIGGVSGSIVDFYLLCKAVGLSGYNLAEAILHDIAALVAGHQHSLGELLFAAAMTEYEEHQEPGIVGGTTREGFIRPSSNGFYFASEEMMNVVRLMNLPEEEYQLWIGAQDPLGPHTLYMAALNEFITRVVSFDFDWDAFEVVSGFNASIEEEHALRTCFKHEEATWDFTLAVMDVGGYKDDPSNDGEDTYAWRKWAHEGINGVNQVISATAFVSRISQVRSYVWTIMGESENGDKDTQQQVEWLSGREQNLGALYDCLRQVEGTEDVSERAFKLYYYFATAKVKPQLGGEVLKPTL
eukprot:TRINITY_DN7215_c0_g1_i1.p1 TRINITY_DN7215_c0_g1~~TRINITY_DN7215_c0_g1_i1.p1  ORF type:complete len:598 (+),score=100.06 TRINITY_DN7215_c0_g1_i1:49-1842(+)